MVGSADAGNARRFPMKSKHVFMLPHKSRLTTAQSQPHEHSGASFVRVPGKVKLVRFAAGDAAKEYKA